MNCPECHRLWNENEELRRQACGRVNIGQYTISRFDYISVWIEHESGEGMQTSTEDLEKVIDEFYKTNF